MNCVPVVFLIAVLASGLAVAVEPPTAPAATGQTPSNAAASATCQYEVEGYGSSRPGIKSATLSCTGPSPITAAAAGVLRAALGPKGGSRGVTWSASPACKEYVDLAGCLFVLCPGTAATFVRPVLKNYRPSPEAPALFGLCVVKGSQAVIKGGSFTGSALRSVMVADPGTSLLVANSTFEGAEKAGPAGALAASGGRLVVESSKFAGNSADKGGAIFAFGQALVEVDPEYQEKSGQPGTTFRDNVATDAGGDVYASDQATVRLTGASLQGASAVMDGSLSLWGNATLEMLASSVSKATAAERRGGIGLSENATLIMLASAVTGCSTRTGAAGGIGARGTATAVLVGSNVTNNVAGTEPGAAAGAGGINAAEASVIVLDSARVSGNKAAYGGGLLIINDATLAVKGKTRITANTAGQAGGGVLMASAGFDPEQLAAATTGNRAPTGSDLSLEARRITILGSNSSLDEFVTSTDSRGGLLHLTLNVTGPQGLPSDDPVKVSLLDEAGATIYTETARGAKDGSAPGIRVVAIKIRQPPGNYTLRLETDGLTDESAPPVDQPLRIVPCPKGYVTASTGDACIPCVKGFFSFNPYDQECTMCPVTAVCPGGARLYPKAGYWHSARQSVQVHKCFNPAACVGAAALNGSTAAAADSQRRRLLGAGDGVEEYKTAQCNVAYQGNLCGDCRAGYGKVRAFLCRKCMSKGVIILLYIAAALAMMALIKLLLYFNRTSNNATRTNLQQARPEEFLKVLVLHGQWLYIMSNLVGIPWPASLSYPMQVISGLWSSASGTSIGLDCVLPRTSAVPLGVQKVLLCLLTPAAILCILVTFEGLLHYFRPRRSVRVRDQLFSLVFCIVFLFLPTWLSTAFSLFTCVKLDGPASPPFEAAAVGSFWVEDMSQLCNSGYHRAWAIGLGVPVVLLLCFGLPVGVFVFMWVSRKQGRLQETLFIRHYGFMYHLWREGVCWWESVLVLQTIGLVSVATFGFSMGPYFQGLVTLAVLASVIVLLLWVRPFLCRQANHVAVASGCVLLFTAFNALTFLPYDGVEAGQAYRNVMGVAVLLGNMVFLLFTAWKLVQSVDWVALKQAMRSALSRTTCGSKYFVGPGQQSLDAGMFIESVHAPGGPPAEDVPGGKGKGRGKDVDTIGGGPAEQLPK